jgi:hypothetical protein
VAAQGKGKQTNEEQEDETTIKEWNHRCCTHESFFLPLPAIALFNGMTCCQKNKKNEMTCCGAAPSMLPDRAMG